MTNHANQAIDRLARALHELSYRGRISLTPEVRMLLAPGAMNPEDVPHAIGFTVEIADLLAEAVERLLTTEGPSDPFHAHVFALAKPDLATEIREAFTGIDLTELTRQVLDDTDPRDRMAVTRALDDMFGDVTAPGAEDDIEDGFQ